MARMAGTVGIVGWRGKNYMIFFHIQSVFKP